MTPLDRLRQRAVHMLRGEKSEIPIRFCPRCGDAFTTGGARTIVRGDPDCKTPMVDGTPRAALEILDRAEP